MSGSTGLYGLNEPALPPRKKSRVWTVIKIMLALCFLALISLASLHRAGGNSENLKQMVETYFSDSSGYKANVNKLNAVSFYPLVGLDLEDVAFETPGQTTVARIGKLNFSTSFWSAASGESIHTLDLQHIDIDTGIAAPGKILVERFFIDTKTRDIPQLSFNGFYGGKPVIMTADMRTIKGKLGGTYFNFENSAPFDLTAGDIHLTGNILSSFTGRSLEISKMSVGGKDRVAQATIALNGLGKNLLLSGKVKNNDTGFEYATDYSRKGDRRILTGNITGEKIDLNDVTGADGLFSDYKVFYNFWRAGQKADAENVLVKTDLGLDLHITHFISKGQDAGPLNGHAVIKGGVLVVEPQSAAGDQFAAAMNAYFKK